MEVTKITIKTNKVFLFFCHSEEFTEFTEGIFKAWVRDYLMRQYPDKAVTIFTEYEHFVISAIAVVDINEGQEADIENINTQEL